MNRRDPRRQDEPVIVGMRHDDGADQARAHAPARRPPKLLRACARLKLNPARPRKILAEEMRGTRLNRFAILDHRFNAERLDRAREAFALRFLTAENRNGEMVAHESRIDFEHLFRLRQRLHLRLVDGVALLPKEFSRAQENSRTHFPADDIGPLIDENGEIAIALHPLRVARADDGFGSRPNDQRFSQWTGRHHFPFGVYLQAGVRHHRAFLGEALHVRRFLLEITQRNEERKIRVPMSGRLEHGIELALHVFPNAVAPRTDHHAAADI